MTKLWKTVALGQLCSISSGESDTQDAVIDGPFAFFDRSKTIKRSSRFLYDCEALIIPGEGKEFLPRQFGGKFDLHQRAYALFNFAPELQIRFLYHLLHYRSDYFPSVAVGATVKSLRRRHFEDFPTPVPPLQEQHRIVASLDQAFEAIARAKDNAGKNLKNARALFESQLRSVFQQRGPRWVETTLEKVLAVQPQNGWSPPAANHSSSGTPVLTLSSVTGFQFKPDKIKFTSAATDSQRRYWVENGDLLITRSNTPELVGHVAIANGISRATIYPDLIMRMNPSPDRAITEFLYYQLRTPALRKEITSRAQGANPTMKKISNGAVRTLPITVPPIAKQREIVDLLISAADLTERLAGIYERKLAVLDALKKSLLHRAFGGELTAGKIVELVEAVA